jgi:signal peptidase I
VTLDAHARSSGSASPATRRARASVTVLASMISRTVLGSLIGLFVWAQLPALVLGWTTAVVQSGSMRPALMPGDVVVYQPPRGRTPAVGQIVLARDPTRSTTLLTHRVHRVLPGNEVITKGDANPTPDSTPLRSSSIRGVARLRIPWIGLPVQLWRARRHLSASGMLLGLAVLAVLATRPPRHHP